MDQIYIYYVVGVCRSDLHILCSCTHEGQIYYAVGACASDLHYYVVGGMWVRSTFVM